ncbi:MAG TPA: MlaD family protein [Pseudonocardiaceae bacterium]|nr:MlaD family protein [Pseudonocardiaceae bacterium]
MSRSTTRSFVVGIGGLVVLVLILLFGVTASSGLPGAPTTMVQAAFTNVGAPLQVGDDVRENSSRIGRVSALSYANGEGIVTLQLDGHVPVYSDARAAIWDQSALAKKFVEIDVGHPSAGLLGTQVLPPSRDVNSADLDQLLDVLDPPTRNALASTLRQVGDGVAGHSQDVHDLLEHLPATLTDVGGISTELSNQDTNLPALLSSADQLAGALNGHEQQLSSLVQQLATTVRALSVDGGQPLGNTLRDLPSTLTDARTSFTALNQPLDDVRSALLAIQPGAGSLGQATPDLRGVLTEGITPLNKVPGVATAAQPAVTDLTTTLADARPLAPEVSAGLTEAALPVSVLAEYTNQVVSFFERVESMVSTSVSPGVHGARVGVAADAIAQATGGVLPDVLQGQDAYPAPGSQADSDRTVSPLNLVPPTLLSGGK